MAVKMRNMLMGILIAGFMVIAMSSFAEEWAGEVDREITGDVLIIKGDMNSTLQEMYEKSKQDEDTISKSKIYTGTSDIGISSAESYKVLKDNLATAKTTVLNATTSMTRMLHLPSWVKTLAISAFMLIMAAMFLNAIFKRDI